MSLKPQPPRLLTPEQVAWGAEHLPKDSVYRLVGDKLFALYHDEDFLDLYHKEGKPAISPVLLSFVTVFQSLEDLPDRLAAYFVEVRKDWAYALHLPPDYPGFDSTVLCDFRARLLTHGAEARIFELVLTQMKALGLLTERGIQRTDSLAILTKARLLTRTELLVESVRLALRALLRANKAWAQTTLPAAWDERYSTRYKSERRSDEEQAAFLLTVGADGQQLIDLLAAEGTPEGLRDLLAVTVLQTVWTQHFTLVAGVPVLKQAGKYDGKTHIQTPYDPEARWAEKHGHGWTGDKLHVTETDDADKPHLITDVGVVSAEAHDSTALPEIRARQQARGVLPHERYADKGYVDGGTITAGQQVNEDLIGPLRDVSTPQSRMEDGFTHTAFQIDWEARQVTCPQGATASITQSGTVGTQATFDHATCAACPLKARCCTGSKNGRSLRFGPHYQETQAARERQTTAAFKQQYRLHRSGVEGCLSGLVRGQGVRVNRYLGRKKNTVRALFIAAAVNLCRGAAWLAGKRHRPKRPERLGLAPAGP